MSFSKKDFNVYQARKDFPALAYCNTKGQPIIYLDNAATTQKPQCVIAALNDFYLNKNANVHRSFYDWGKLSTEAYEKTREKLANFIGAQFKEEIIFTRGATEAINCIAEIIGQHYFKEDDEVIISELEHHSNIVPWQIQKQKRKIRIKALSILQNGDIDPNQLDNLLTPKTKLLAITHVSNVLGTILPLKELIAKAHANNTLVLIDGAQALAHIPICVKDLDCDFLVGSGHKIYGPMGSGFFYGKRSILENLPPYHGGGTMVETVYIDSFTPTKIPNRFEAGTPPVADIIGMGAAIDYLQQYNWQDLIKHEDKVLCYAETALQSLPHVQVIGKPEKRTAAVPFLIKNVHPHDVATIVNHYNVALRAGFHCCQPLMRRLECKSGVIRASFGLYNTCKDVDSLIDALKSVFKIFKL